MDKTQFGDEALVQWTCFFKVEQFGDNFGCYIETDGVSVSINIKKPIHNNDNDNSNKDFWNLDLTGKKVVGLDPGRRDLFVSADTNDNTAKCSTKEYYYLANFTRNRKKRQKWFDKVYIHNDTLLLFILFILYTLLTFFFIKEPRYQIFNSPNSYFKNIIKR